MAIWHFKCEICGQVFRTKKTEPSHCDKLAKKLMSIPQVKYMEKSDPFMGSSTLKDMDAITLERSRNYSRDHELDELIQENKEHTNPHDNAWLTKNGTKRTKMDDL